MKACFDTSVLVAALLKQHPHHGIAFPRLREVHDGLLQGCITTHGIAELFATLTALPLKPRLSPVDARNIIENSVLKQFILIPLGADEYRNAMGLASGQNLSSGAIYDALHIVGSRIAGCAMFYTLNLRHFQALAPGDPMISGP